MLLSRAALYATPFRRWSLKAALTATLSLVAIAVLLRLHVLGHGPYSPFGTLVPVILVVSFGFGRWAGVLATAMGASLGALLFVAPGEAPLTWQGIVVTLLFIPLGLLLTMAADAVQGAGAELARAQDALAATRQQLQDREQEIAALTGEFRQRVKDDLSRIAAMLRMTAEGEGDAAAAALRAVAERIGVLARVQEGLQRRGAELVLDSQQLLQQLAADLQDRMAEVQPVGLFVDAESHVLPASRGAALALMTRELMQDCYHHAASQDATGSIALRFRREGDDYVLSVTDDGLRPAAAATTARECGSFGRRLARAVAAQLGGRLRRAAASAAAGVEARVQFPAVPLGRAPGV